MQAMTTAQREGANLAAKFNRLKEETGITKAEFARRYKVPGGPSMISQNISGHRPIGLEQAAAYMLGFGCAIEEISPSLSAKMPRTSTTPTSAEAPQLAATEPSGPPAGHIRIQVFDAAPSAGPGREPADYAAVLGHIDLAEQWARKRLGDRLDSIRALPVKGDSMSPTINDGDLAFVDTGCTHFEGEGVYVLVFNHALLIKRLSADFATQRIQILSDNEHHKPALAREDELNICGRVRMWMSVRCY